MIAVLIVVAEVLMGAAGDPWSAAFEAVMTHNAALVAQGGVTVQPVTDPDGETLAGYVELRGEGRVLDRQLVVGGKVVTWRAGLPVLSGHLRAQGFPARLVSRYLLTDLLQYFAVMPRGFTRDTRAGWGALDAVILRADGEGAVLVVPGVVTGESGGGLAPDVPRRLEVRFDREATPRFVVYEDRGAGFVEVAP
ncbi:MAG: hypothetical protein AMXMBFR64_41880 [Myxococcales bacterium]